MIGVCNRTAVMVTGAKIGKVSDGEESRTDEGANGGGLLVSIVCTVRDVIARSDQFGFLYWTACSRRRSDMKSKQRALRSRAS